MLSRKRRSSNQRGPILWGWLCLGLCLFGSPPPTVAQAPAGADAKNEAPPEPVITNPLVDALLETKPSTPEELVRAIDTLIDLKHAPVARPLVNQLLAAMLDNDKLASLARRFGSPTFLRMTTLPELQPEGRQLAEAVLSAYSNQVRDPDRLAAQIARLKGASFEHRQDVYSELRSAGEAAVIALIGVLADPTRSDEHADAQSALVALGSPAVQPLVATLESPVAALRVQAIDVLRRLQATEAAPYLVAPALASESPGEVQAAARRALEVFTGQPLDAPKAGSLLYSQARIAYEQSVPPGPDEPPTRDVWRWDSDNNVPVVESRPVAEASLSTALRLSRDLRRLYPDSELVRRLYLGALLESAAYQAGPDQPLPQGDGTAHAEAAALGPAAINELLAHSMASGRLLAATAAARILGDVGSPELLYDPSARLSPLVKAVLHKDRHLSYAAADAVMRLKPEKPYPGSSHVLDALAYVAGTSGVPRALVIDTQPHEARRLAGLLAPLDFDADIAVDGRNALQMLNASPDYGLVLLDFNLARTNVDEWLQQLRRDHRTAALPVALVASVDDRLSAEHVASRDELSAVIIRPLDTAGLEFQVSGLLSKTPRRLTSPQRIAQAQGALAHLGALASQRQKLYNLQSAAEEVEAALHVPELMPLAAPLLADLGTAAGQQALVGMAGRASNSLEMRQTAAAAFDRAVRRYGILLTTAEVQQQYALYNQSETAPPEVQAVLGSILDSIESRTQPAAQAEPAPPTAVEPPPAQESE